MADVNLVDSLGVIKARIIFPVYQDETVVGQKKVTENLGYVKGGTSDTSKIIINAFMNLYGTHELDSDNTTITYEENLDLYIGNIEEEEYSIITPENTNWAINNSARDQLGTEYKKNWGYINGDLTPEKARVFDSLVRAMVNLSTNTYNATTLSAVFKPYKGAN